MLFLTFSRFYNRILLVRFKIWFIIFAMNVNINLSDVKRISLFILVSIRSCRRKQFRSTSLETTVFHCFITVKSPGRGSVPQWKSKRCYSEQTSFNRWPQFTKWRYTVLQPFLTTLKFGRDIDKRNSRCSCCTD